jgi:hypothetical protein
MPHTNKAYYERRQRRANMLRALEAFIPWLERQAQEVEADTTPEASQVADFIRVMIVSLTNCYQLKAEGIREAPWFGPNWGDVPRPGHYEPIVAHLDAAIDSELKRITATTIALKECTNPETIRWLGNEMVHHKFAAKVYQQLKVEWDKATGPRTVASSNVP